jgi:hypothetical protein
VRALKRPLAAVLMLLAVGVGVAVAGSASAQSQVSGPTVVPERYELRIGERVRMTLDGFNARAVTMVFCGNDGRRGSTDCNMRAGQSREISQDGTLTRAEMEVPEPPAPCPCIIRVSSQDNREIAVASVTLVGHPVADVVGGSEFVQALAVDIDAVVASPSFGDAVRSSLGGPTPHEVTVEVRNQATFVIENVRATANYRRTQYDDVRNIPIENPGTLQPGEVWTQKIDVEVPSLTFGTVEWRIDATGAGPAVTSTDSTSKQPVLLYVAALILIADAVFLFWRFISRRMRRRPDADTAGDLFHDDPIGPDDDVWSDTRVYPVLADGPDTERQDRQPVG